MDLDKKNPKVEALVNTIRKAHLTRAELRQLEERIYELQYEEIRPGSTVKELPPKVPNDVDGLNRAICLLGNRMTADLGTKARSELVKLIGVYPNLEQASQWKRSLSKTFRSLTSS